MKKPENQDLSPEEIEKRKQEMLSFYKESVPYLEAQLSYETLLVQLDEVRVRRIKAQHEMAYLSMTPEQEAELRRQAEEMEQNLHDKNPVKERKLKTK